MNAADSIRTARLRAGLTQHALAARAGTSQATISAYEAGRKQPSLATLERVLAATGARLEVVPERREPTPEQLARAGRVLGDVLELAAALPTRHRRPARVPAAADPAAHGVTLPERLVALHRSLAEGGVPHAFGGAIALAYWTLDPRGTSDIDCNLFVPAAEPGPALDALPDGIARPPGTADAIARDGQIRLWWDDTPVDLFFDYAPVHEQAARNATTVSFRDTEIPILGPVELVVFKVMFDRTRDWADVEAVLEAGTVDVEAVRRTLLTLVEPDDPRLARLTALAGVR